MKSFNRPDAASAYMDEVAENIHKNNPFFQFTLRTGTMNKNRNIYTGSVFTPFENPSGNVRVGTLRGIKFEHDLNPAGFTTKVYHQQGVFARKISPVFLMQSRTARDQLGFPTYREIINAEFEMLN